MKIWRWKHHESLRANGKRGWNEYIVLFRDGTGWAVSAEGGWGTAYVASMNEHYWIPIE